MLICGKIIWCRLILAKEFNRAYYKIVLPDDCFVVWIDRCYVTGFSIVENGGAFYDRNRICSEICVLLIALVTVNVNERSHHE